MNSYVRTFIMIKPDAVDKSGRILAEFEEKGYTITQMRVCYPNIELIKEHYIEHKNKDMYNELCNRFVDKKLYVYVLCNSAYKDQDELVKAVRTLIGNVNLPGTLRFKYGKSHEENSIHASDSSDSVEREIKLWFNN